MKRPRLRLVLVAAATAVFATLAGTAWAAPVASESFEAGFGPWQPDTDGRAPTSSVTISSEQRFDGIRSVRIFMDGRQDDGTTWIEAQFTGPPLARVLVTVQFQLWSPGSGAVGGWNVVGAAGLGNPETEAQFTRIGTTDVTAGWRPYGRTFAFHTDASGRFWVAVGTSVIWEVQKAHFIDLLKVDVVKA